MSKTGEDNFSVEELTGGICDSEGSNCINKQVGNRSGNACTNNKCTEDKHSCGCVSGLCSNIRNITASPESGVIKSQRSFQISLSKKSRKQIKYVNTNKPDDGKNINRKSTPVWFWCQRGVTACQQETFNYLSYISQNDKCRPQAFEPMVTSQTCLFCLAVKKL